MINELLRIKYPKFLIQKEDPHQEVQPQWGPWKNSLGTLIFLLKTY